jgi:hypothetical protein
MNHVDMAVAAVPPEAAQASLGSQPKHQRHSLPWLQVNLLLGSLIVKSPADSNDRFSGRDILLEMADGSESVRKTWVIEDYSVVTRLNRYRARNLPPGISVEDPADNDSVLFCGSDIERESAEKEHPQHASSN